MKLRFYLRGLGIGIIVTALLMGISGTQREKLTDEEIRTKAAMLGMVDGGTTLLSLSNGEEKQKLTEESSNSQPDEKNQQEEKAQTKESSRIAESTQTEESSAINESAQATESENRENITGSVENTNSGASSRESDGSGVNSTVASQEAGDQDTASQEATMLTFTIQRGASSEGVSRNLAELGLIDDASGFNSFLVRGGYSNVIAVGSFQIPAGATWQEIAEIITRRR